MNDFDSERTQVIAPMGSLTATRYHTQYVSGEYHTYISSQYAVDSTFTGLVGQRNWDPVVTGNSTDDSLANRAVTAAYAKLSEADVLGLVSLAELHKSVKTVKKLYGETLWWLQRGVSIKKKLKRLLISQAQAASLWMEC
jgi:hypothetical protein